MSEYSDYKHGLITYAQYRAAMAEEDRRDKDYEDHMGMNEPMTCEYCSYRKDVCINMASRYYGEEVDLEDSCEDWE